MYCRILLYIKIIEGEPNGDLRVSDQRDKIAGVSWLDCRGDEAGKRR
jgi:hypothetical protein